MARECSNLHRCSVWLLANAQTCTGVAFGGSRVLKKLLNHVYCAVLDLGYSDLCVFLISGEVEPGLRRCDLPPSVFVVFSASTIKHIDKRSLNSQCQLKTAHVTHLDGVPTLHS